MFSFFKTDPVKKLQEQQDKLFEDAMHAQRNGDIHRYSMLTMEAESLNEKINEAKARNAR